jgi:hypothetical protein
MIARIRYRDDATITADDGSFTFEGLGFGEHTLLALRGRWNDTSATVELPLTEPVLLTLPEAASTAVRVLLPEGEPYAGLALQLGMQKGEQVDTLRMIRARIAEDPWTCGSDGVFPAGFLPLGAVTFELTKASTEPIAGGIELLLHPEAVVTGTRDVELDLRESFPLRVTLRAPQPEVVPDASWRLELNLEAESAQRTKPASVVRWSEFDRSTQLRWASPGKYRVTASAPGIAWSSPEPLNVVRGAANDFELDVPLVSRRVGVVAADGAPLANTVVAYWTDSPSRAVGRTDADGALEVVLLRGTLSVALPPPREPAPDGDLHDRTSPSRPMVDPLLLMGLTARATADFAPGEEVLVARLGPE